MSPLREQRIPVVLVTLLLAVALAASNAIAAQSVGFAPPINLQTWQSGRSVELTWSPPAVGQILGYNVYRSEHSNGPWTKLNDKFVGQTTYVDHSPISGVSWYAVSAISADAVETGQTPPSGITFFPEVASDVSGQIFSLTHFPLSGEGWWGAYGRQIINSVFDHSMRSNYQNNYDKKKKCPWDSEGKPWDSEKNPYKSKKDRKCVIAYTGEIGNTNPVNPTKVKVNGKKKNLYAYAKPDATSFSLNGSYLGPGTIAACVTTSTYTMMVTMV